MDGTPQRANLKTLGQARLQATRAVPHSSLHQPRHIPPHTTRNLAHLPGVSRLPPGTLSPFDHPESYSATTATCQDCRRIQVQCQLNPGLLDPMAATRLLEANHASVFGDLQQKGDPFMKYIDKTDVPIGSHWHGGGKSQSPHLQQKDQFLAGLFSCDRPLPQYEGQLLGWPQLAGRVEGPAHRPSWCPLHPVQVLGMHGSSSRSQTADWDLGLTPRVGRPRTSPSKAASRRNDTAPPLQGANSTGIFPSAFWWQWPILAAMLVATTLYKRHLLPLSASSWVAARSTRIIAKRGPHARSSRPCASACGFARCWTPQRRMTDMNGALDNALMDYDVGMWSGPADVMAKDATLAATSAQTVELARHRRRQWRDIGGGNAETQEKGRKKEDREKAQQKQPKGQGGCGQGGGKACHLVIMISGPMQHRDTRSGTALINLIQTDGSGEAVQVTNVLFVHGLSTNHMSVRALLRKKFKVVFEGEICMFLDKKNTHQASITLKGGPYALHIRDNAALSRNGSRHASRPHSQTMAPTIWGHQP
ncbi:hypothetical protein BDK51DRAFT_45848 [Blyttiomyces helicus]|uniref:Uncharacterized protein n=1 Tax=Blyttiomyces helicus TaxID=388810 RepID=A0A4P9WGC8_9FUNG|nr:hypothetical protein BDK51DRAFT_45848 [Blyttiomyces helicus]|eukprot:RKO90080.1 hypothetical protein BDK51DRAFT_45848 [Blyttiomyces helicus]